VASCRTSQWQSQTHAHLRTRTAGWEAFRSCWTTLPNQLQWEEWRECPVMQQSPHRDRQWVGQDLCSGTRHLHPQYHHRYPPERSLEKTRHLITRVKGEMSFQFFNTKKNDYKIYLGELNRTQYHLHIYIQTPLPSCKPSSDVGYEEQNVLWRQRWRGIRHSHWSHKCLYCHVRPNNHNQLNKFGCNIKFHSINWLF